MIYISKQIYTKEEFEAQTAVFKRLGARPYADGTPSMPCVLSFSTSTKHRDPYRTYTTSGERSYEFYKEHLERFYGDEVANDWLEGFLEL